MKAAMLAGVRRLAVRCAARDVPGAIVDGAARNERATPPRRRGAIAALTGLTGVLLTGCATPPPGPSGDLPPGDRIVEVRSGRSVTRAELLEAIRRSDYALLGEQHDNGFHHARRGELLAALRPPAAVVAEHLPRGSGATLSADLPASLGAAGFDPKGWRWPLHEPLFAGVARAGLPLTGGNLPRDEARRVVMGGPPALPEALAAVVAAAPLPAAAQAALDDDLVRGHCGQLAGRHLDGMRLAQRGRDASMWLALREADGKPAVLVAGNGHVRLDYGVGQLAAALQPAARLVSVGFVEQGADVGGLPYTYAWVTPSVERKDPCAGFAMPAR